MSKVIVDGVEWQEFLVEFQTQEGTFNFKLFAVDWAHAIDRLEELKATAKVVGDNCSEVPAAPVQEPVAFIESLKDAQPCCGQYETCYRACTPRGKFLGHRDAKRQWVGLTLREIYNLWEDSGVPFVAWDSFASITRAIEAKLREKNGGAA